VDQQPRGEAVIYRAEDEDKARFVVEHVRALRDDHRSPPSAVLPHQRPVRALEDELMRWGVPYRHDRRAAVLRSQGIRGTRAPARDLNPWTTPPSAGWSTCRAGGWGSEHGPARSGPGPGPLMVETAATGSSVPGDAGSARPWEEFARWIMGYHAQREGAGASRALARCWTSGLQASSRDTSEGRNAWKTWSSSMSRCDGSWRPVTIPLGLPHPGHLLTDQDTAQRRRHLMTLHGARDWSSQWCSSRGWRGLFPHKRTLDKPDELEGGGSAT
jgi:hypothetical protein